MDKDRIAGAAKEIKGAIKTAIGKAVGDAKLQSDGKADQDAGKLQNAIGSIKDASK
ncbi:CsbD family protein [Telmatospirillum sp.]|uniref:CsbD family protein n=1 Tax=Telmatospirillum sp. TaxID=2079197 RepID=UPI002845A3A9|nr:CsbD family protein [Telmatospirillum sp.]MDR3440528.1 CsbD family protein [Telmatospirillum sp.]